MLSVRLEMLFLRKNILRQVNDKLNEHLFVSKEP